MTEKNLHVGHRKRLRELCDKIGLDNMPEHQALELILSYIIPQKDTNPIAHNLIKEFGSLSNVFDASTEALSKVKGIGEVAASFINLCSQIPLVYKKSKITDKLILNTPSKVTKYLTDTISIGSVEKFYLTYINNKCELIKTESFGSGFIDNVQINFRELMKGILKHPVSGVIISHTHPHGNALPSISDIKFTKQFLISINSVGISLLDHIILANSGTYSFLNSGELEKYKTELKILIDQTNYVANHNISFHKD